MCLAVCLHCRGSSCALRGLERGPSQRASRTTTGYLRGGHPAPSVPPMRARENGGGMAGTPLGRSPSCGGDARRDMLVFLFHLVYTFQSSRRRGKAHRRTRARPGAPSAPRPSRKSPSVLIVASLSHSRYSRGRLLRLRGVDHPLGVHHALHGRGRDRLAERDCGGEHPPRRGVRYHGIVRPAASGRARGRGARARPRNASPSACTPASHAAGARGARRSERESRRPRLLSRVPGGPARRRHRGQRSGRTL